MEVRQEIQTEVRPLQQEMKNQKATLEKLEERFNKVEKRPVALVSNVPGGSEATSMVIGKATTFKIPTFDGSGAWELYHKQFEAAAAHNQWSNAEKAVALTVHLKGTAKQVLAALPQTDNSEYATLVNCLEQRFGQRHHTPVRRWELKNHIQKSGEGLQDCEVNI